MNLIECAKDIRESNNVRSRLTLSLDDGTFASKDPNKTANLMIDCNTVKNNQSVFQMYLIKLLFNHCYRKYLIPLICN